MLTEKNTNGNSGKKITFLQIREHQLVETDKTQHDDTWVRRVVYNPNDKEQTNPIVKFYKFYDSVSGKITDIFWYDNAPFKGYKITLTDGDENYQIDISANNYKVMEKFLTTFENINLQEPVKIVVWAAPVKDKKSGDVVLNQDGSKKIEPAFVIYQDEKVVPRKYNKENPVPSEYQPVQAKKTNKWNFDKYYEFLYEQVDNVISANFAKLEPNQVEEEEGLPDDETIPF